MNAPKTTLDADPGIGQPDRAQERAAGRGRLGLHLRYAFEPGEQSGADLRNALFDALVAVRDGGSIRDAAKRLGTSYRHLWNSLRGWEKNLGEPLIVWSQGRKARLTEFAQKLVWAEQRVRLRLQPHIEALRADLDRVVIDARDDRQQLLTVRASHDLALPILQHAARAADLHMDIGFPGSGDALRALNDRQCLVAGFHVPSLTGREPVFMKTLKPLLRPKIHRLIACSRRMQGLMVRREHASLIRDVPDLIRLRMRFVNRQAGSGTRMLIQHLLTQHGLPPDSLGDGQHIENSDVAVAICVASGVVDAGAGVEAAAVQLGLHFVPLVEEHYFLACHGSDIDHPAISALRALLAGPRWQSILADLPGYRPAVNPGSVLVIEDVLPWWRQPRNPNPVS